MSDDRATGTTGGIFRRTTLDIPMPSGTKPPRVDTATAGELPLEAVKIIEAALFHFWNCDGACGKLHHAMARLAALTGYQSYPGQAKEIASYVGKDVELELIVGDITDAEQS